MTKQDMIRQFAAKFDVTNATAEEMIQFTVDTLIDAAVSEGRANFGNHAFVKITYKERAGRNPTTGESIVIPEKIVVKHKFIKR